MGRFKVWILMIIGLFILGFLVAFAPVRPMPKGFTVQSTFQYTLPQPAAAEGANLDSASGEVTAELRGKVADLNYAKFLSTTLLEVATFAVTDTAAQADHTTVTQILAQTHPGIKAEPLPQQGEHPLYTIGNFLAIYPPRPQIRLGLDLQGGAHVVLIAKPRTTLSFVSPDARPMVNLPAAATGAETPATPETGATPEASATPAAATPEAAATPKTAPAVSTAGLPTPDEIQNNIRAALQRAGTDPATVTVDAVAATRIVVTTEAIDKTTADAQKAVVQNYLNNAYPGVKIDNDKTDSLFLDANTANIVRDTIERRLYAMSDVREPVVQTQGTDRVIVELPGVKDPKRVIEILGKTAELQFALIPDKYEPPNTEPGIKTDYSFWTDKYTHQSVPWKEVYAESGVQFTGRDLKANAKVVPGQGLALVVSFELVDNRKEDFRKFTGGNVGRLMAIVLDGVCQSAPVINGEIPGNGIIEGNFTPDEARDLSLLLNGGALPVPLEIAENRTVSATLGADSIRRMLLAGLLGFILIVVFMAAYYRVPGMFADIALLLFLVLLGAVLTMANATLTLAGIAGFIMSLGMAVDANILIFERLKEELYAGKSPRSAVVAGFDRAWTAILDANVTTLIGASVLYFLGTSSIKSFAVTLFLGVVVHLFTAVTVSRWFVTMFTHSRYGQTLSHYGVPKPPSVQGAPVVEGK
jgi:preprotein translocase subunit SecD